MTPDSGIDQDRTQGHLSKSHRPFLLTGQVKSLGQRMISGVANSPVVDRENEFIMAEAMEKAIPSFLKIPVLHVDHTERPIGFVTECRVLKSGDVVLYEDHPDYDPDAKIGDTYFKAKIPHEGDTDDIWESIQKGARNKISIYGVRTEASGECKLRPHERVSPCVTKAIRLWSFSLVGDNAINSASYIKVAKSFAPDLCPEFEENTIELIKAAFPGNNMAPIADQQDQSPGDGADVNTRTDADVVMKSDLDPVVQDVTLMKSDIADVKTGMTAILDFIKKSSQDETPGEEKKDEDPTQYITKANLETTLDLIVKAKIDLAVADIKKAYDEKFAAFTKQMEAFGSETIRKGGHTVVLDMDGNPLGAVDNSFLSNLDALEA